MFFTVIPTAIAILAIAYMLKKVYEKGVKSKKRNKNKVCKTK